MASNGYRFAIACEDQAHHALVSFLTDQVLLAEAALRGAHWIDADSLPLQRTFCGRGPDNGEPERPRFYNLKYAQEDASALQQLPMVGGRPLRLRGHIHGKPLKPEASLWRRVLILFAQEQPRPDALIVVRDTDGRLDRTEGLEQALELTQELDPSWPVLVATPHQDAEAWFVAGFVATPGAEAQRLEQLKKELSFSPPDEPHRLTAHPNSAATDAKRVLRVLAFDESESRPPSPEELPALCKRTLKDLKLLEKRGGPCKLGAFLLELRKKLVPVMILGPPSPGG